MVRWFLEKLSSEISVNRVEPSFMVVIAKPSILSISIWLVACIIISPETTEFAFKLWLRNFLIRMAWPVMGV